MKRIPKAFTMGPHRIEVRIVSEDEMRAHPDGGGDNPHYGLCDYETGTIYVQKTRKGLTKVLQMHTFWHEYMHMLFYHVGRERLSRDETLVDNCGAMQLQAFTSAEF